MKLLSFGAAVLAASVLGATPAQADSFTFNFCGFAGESASCDEDHIDLLSEASLTFETVDGTADPNDYTLTVRFVGVATDVFIDAIDFEIDELFAAKPVLTSAPAGTVVGDWSIAFDKVNASALSNCADTLAGTDKFACAKDTTANGPSVAGTNDWVFDIDLVSDGVDDYVVSAASKPNLRALFVDDEGDKVGAILSPGGVFETTGGSEDTGGGEDTGTVPEPAVLVLFGAGLAAAGYRARRKS